jgi:hypothetical protein
MGTTKMLRAVLLALLTVATAIVSLAQPCIPRFMPGWDGPTLNPSPGAAAVMFDDGTGPTLYASGDVLPTPIPDRFNLTKFVNGDWVGVSGPNGPVYAMITHVEAGREVLYIGGSFTEVNGIASPGVARFDGVTWTALPGLSIENYSINFQQVHGVQALAFYDGVPGAGLYAGGAITVDGTEAISRWDGTQWLPLGDGLSGPWARTAVVRSLAVHDAGAGPRLWVGGDFRMVKLNESSGFACNSLATWDGSYWHQADAGLSATTVRSLCVHDAGTGPRLYAAGDLGGSTPARVKVLNDGTWTPAVADSTYVYAKTLVSHNNGTGPALYMLSSNSWDESNFSYTTWAVQRLGDSGLTTVSVVINAKTLVSIGTGPSKLVLINSSIPGAYACDPGILPFEPTGRGYPGPLFVITSDPGARDGAYFASGTRLINGVPALSPDYTPGTRWIDRINTPSGPAIVSVGHAYKFRSAAVTIDVSFDPAAGLMATKASDHLEDFVLVTARDGETLDLYRTRTGELELIASVAFPGFVSAISYYNGHIYLAGDFTINGSAISLARLDGNQLLPISDAGTRGNDLHIFDLGEGPELIIATSSPGLLKWNGSRLAQVTPTDTFIASVLHVFDDGSGPRLYAGGGTTQALRYWNGTGWTSVGQFNASARVTTLTDFASPDGSRSLLLGGSFNTVDGLYCLSLAELAACRATCTSDFNGDSDFGTDQDVEAFFACLTGNCCLTCGSPDFNNDGDHGTDQDIESFFRVLSGAPC